MIGTGTCRASGRSDAHRISEPLSVKKTFMYRKSMV